MDMKNKDWIEKNYIGGVSEKIINKIVSKERSRILALIDNLKSKDFLRLSFIDYKKFLKKSIKEV